MTKILAAILVVLMVLTACSEVPEEPVQPEQQEVPSVPEQEEDPIPEEPQEPEEPLDKGPEHLAYLRDDFPSIDGSTSLIPLEAGIRSAIFGKTIGEATLDVMHTTTWQSYNRILSGEVDMIFSVDLSEQQKEQAKERGVKLESVPVAYEGFVFVVNANNPVDELTQEQLRKIYSGEITNWKEVGGKDAEIIAYQRNNDSGSQNYMIAFMGEVPLMDAPTEKRPGSMAGLMDALAINDNAENAIGYSVYTYAADMYGNGDEVKFVKVDGAEVNKNSMAKGEYPLMGYNYAIFNVNEPEDSNVRKFVEWIASDEGQLAVAKAGYVTMRDIGFDYSEAVLEKFDAVGTGIEKPSGKLPSYEYLAAHFENGYSKYYYSGIGLRWDGKYYINCLADKKLEEEINAFIAEKTEELEKITPELEDYTFRMNGGEEYGVYNQAFVYPNDEHRKHGEPVTVQVKAKNGYIYAEVYLKYWYDVQGGYEHYYKTETAVWDLSTGKRLEATDLFYKGTDIDEALYKYLSVKSNERVDSFYSYEKKADFAGLPKDGWSITPEGIYFDYGNPYFVEGVFLDFETLPEGILATEQPKDMKDYFSKNDAKVIKVFREIRHKWNYKYLNDGTTAYSLLPEDSYPTAKKINSAVEKYLNEYYKTEVITKYFSEKGYPPESIEEALWFSDWYTEDYGGKYVVFSGGGIFASHYEDGKLIKEESYPFDGFLIFDIETGERIDYEDMLSESGKQKISYQEQKGFAFNYLSFYSDIEAFFEGGSSMSLDAEDIRW